MISCSAYEVQSNPDLMGQKLQGLDLKVLGPVWTLKPESDCKYVVIP